MNLKLLCNVYLDGRVIPFGSIVQINDKELAVSLVDRGSAIGYDGEVAEAETKVEAPAPAPEATATPTAKDIQNTVEGL